MHVDQLALLQAEVSSVMLGFTESQDFVSTLEENVRLEEAEAKLVATEVNDQVLLKIREVMKQLPKNQPNASDELAALAHAWNGRANSARAAVPAMAELAGLVSSES